MYRLNDEQALIQTVDFFTPIVDTPYEYGAIAAANALSDVYAMGGQVLFALNIAAFPPNLPAVDAGRHPARRRRRRALGGRGHRRRAHDPGQGAEVRAGGDGLVHPDRILTKGGARPGDALVLTKPLGTGVDYDGGQARAG